MAEGMDFSTLGNEGGAVTADKSASNKIVQDFMNKLNTNPEMKAVLYARSNDLVVEKCLCYGEDGGLIEESKARYDEEGNEVAKRVVRQVPEILGYIIKNIGKEPISYQDCDYAKGADGIFVGANQTKTLAPGASAAISRKYLAWMAAQPEFSFKLGNGKITKGSAKVDPNKSDSLLEAHYFSYFEKNKSVHNDENKTAIADPKQVKDESGNAVKKWIVRPEFEKTFGYLMNPVEKAIKTKGNRAATADYRLAAVAQFVRDMVDQNGLN